MPVVIPDKLKHVPQNLLDQAKELGVDFNIVIQNMDKCNKELVISALWQLYLLGEGDDVSKITTEEITLDFFQQKDPHGSSLAHYAFLFGNQKVIEAILTQAENARIDLKTLLETKNNNGATMAHYAAASGNAKAIEAIFTQAAKAGIDLKTLLETKNNHGVTMAHYAAESGNQEAIEAIFTQAENAGIKRKTLLETKNNYGTTMAHFAAYSGNPEAIEAIFTQAAKVGIDRKTLLETKNNNGITMAHSAADSGNPEAIEEIFTQAEKAGIERKTLLETKNNYGETMAHSAAASGKPEAIEAILTQALNVGIKPKKILEGEDIRKSPIKEALVSISLKREKVYLMKMLENVKGGYSVVSQYSFFESNNKGPIGIDEKRLNADTSILLAELKGSTQSPTAAQLERHRDIINASFESREYGTPSDLLRNLAGLSGIEADVVAKLLQEVDSNKIENDWDVCRKHLDNELIMEGVFPDKLLPALVYMQYQAKLDPYRDLEHHDFSIQ